MKVSRREIILLAVCALVVLFIGLPSIKQITAGAEGGKSVKQLTRELERAQSDKQRLDGEVAALQAEVNKLTWSEETHALPPVLLTTLHETAREAGVTLSTFRPGRLQAAASGSKLPFTVQVRAPFPKVAGFLERLRATQERIALERLQIASADASSDIVALELHLSVYSTKPLAPEKKGKERVGR